MILGIDIGVQGAIAILSPGGELVEIHSMPCLHDGPKGRRTVNGPLLANIIFGAGFMGGVGLGRSVSDRFLISF